MVTHKPESVVLELPHRVEWNTERPRRQENLMSTSTFHVKGMTCGHCVASVTKELMALEGVTEVSVDLEPEGLSAVHVSSSSDISEEAASQAIEEAGYSMADKP